MRHPEKDPQQAETHNLLVHGGFESAYCTCHSDDRLFQAQNKEKTSFRLSYFCVISACFTCKPATMPCGPAVQNQASHMKMTELQ